jgi:hypothetical protein
LKTLKYTVTKYGNMATNTGENRRVGVQRKRSQVKNPVTGQWVKFNDDTGKIMANKEGNRFKGVKEKKKN